MREVFRKRCKEKDPGLVFLSAVPPKRRGDYELEPEGNEAWAQLTAAWIVFSWKSISGPRGKFIDDEKTAGLIL